MFINHTHKQMSAYELILMVQHLTEHNILSIISKHEMRKIYSKVKTNSLVKTIHTPVDGKATQIQTSEVVAITHKARCMASSRSRDKNPITRNRCKLSVERAQTSKWLQACLDSSPSSSNRASLGKNTWANNLYT